MTAFFSLLTDSFEIAVLILITQRVSYPRSTIHCWLAAPVQPFAGLGPGLSKSSAGRAWPWPATI